jgi:hypothetical protein
VAGARALLAVVTATGLASLGCTTDVFSLPGQDGPGTGADGTGGASDGEPGGSQTSGSDGGQTPALRDAFYKLDSLVTVEITMDAGDWSALRETPPQGGLCNWEYTGDRWTWYSAAEVTVNGAAISNTGATAEHSFGTIGIRKKAWCGSHDSVKPGLRIRFEDNSKDQARDQIGVADLVLNNNKQDPAVIRQCIAYSIARAGGVAAPRCNLAQVSVNGQQLGVYSNVEPVKKPFLAERFGSKDGNLYELEGEDFLDWAPDRIEYEGYSADESKADLRQAIQEINQPGLAGIERWIDVDQFLQFWAMEIAVGHLDGYAGAHNNTYVYRDAANGRFRFAMWGTDRAFEAAPEVYGVGVVANKLAADPGYRGRLAQQVQAILQKAWNEDQIVAQIDALAALSAQVPSQVDAGPDPAGIAAVKARIATQRQDLEALLP